MGCGRRYCVAWVLTIPASAFISAAAYVLQLVPLRLADSVLAIDHLRCNICQRSFVIT
jgi:hypothetical protein